VRPRISVSVPQLLAVVAILLLRLTPAIAQETAAIDGVVVVFGTGEPVADAEVELSKTDGPTYSMATGPDGRFAFQNLVPGEYRLVASRVGGFMPAEYGQRSPTGPGIPLVLAGDRRVTAIQLSMARTGSISGRIFDRDGEPVISVTVQALKATYSATQPGQRTLRIAQVVLTNDLGEYRLFWLAPGRYYISARPGGSQRSLVLPPDSEVFEGIWASPPLLIQRTLENGEAVEEAQLPVYFPGSADAGAAASIDVSAGSDVDGVDFILADPIPTRQIQGIVLNGTTGQPEPDAVVSVIPRNVSHDMLISNTRTGPNGSFTLRGVVPGSYLLGTTIGEEAEMTGVVPVEVAGADLENTNVIARPGIDIKGRITFDGWPANNGAPPRVIPDIMRVPFTPGMPLAQNLRSPAPNLQPDNSFVLRGVGAGDYRVFVRNVGFDPQQRTFVKSIRLGSSDVLRDGLHVDTRFEGELEIVIGTNVATLDGEVTDAQQQPVANARVTLVPYPANPQRLDLYRDVSTDTAGRFHMPGLAPGDYLVLAWEDVEYGAWTDPEFLRTYETTGTHVRLEEGATQNVRVAISQ
jgi:protocatechuate 3,4-dioxygenase beta subunit